MFSLKGILNRNFVCHRSKRALVESQHPHNIPGFIAHACNTMTGVGVGATSDPMGLTSQLSLSDKFEASGRPRSENQLGASNKAQQVKVLAKPHDLSASAGTHVGRKKLTSPSHLLPVTRVL